MRGVIPMTAMAVILGIRVRVGAEDNLWRVKGEPTDGGAGPLGIYERSSKKDILVLDDLVDALTFGNVPQVKTALTTVLLALAIYQVAMMSVGYGKVRVPFLKPKAASLAHRSVGDAILPIAILVGWMCLAYFGVEDGIEHAAYGESTRAFLHVVFGSLLLAVLVLKVVVIRWWTALDRFLPHLGLTVFGLFALTWVTSAGDYVFGGR